MPTKTRSERRPSGSQTVDKAIDLIVALAAKPEGTTNVALSRALDIDKSTSHRLLATLERRGFVRRDPVTRRLFLGPRLLELAIGSATNPAMAARPVLHRLVGLVGESASFSLLVDRGFVCLDSVQAPHEMRFAPEVGRPYALNAGATGKAILAFDDELQRAVLGAGELPAFTPNTIVSKERLASQLASVRRNGYAASEAERVSGGCAIASPVFGPTGAVMGAVTISSVTARCDLPRLERFATDLRRGAEEVSRRLLQPHQPQLRTRENDAS